MSRLDQHQDGGERSLVSVRFQNVPKELLLLTILRGTLIDPRLNQLQQRREWLSVGFYLK